MSLKRKVLVVEDEVSLASIIEELLTEEGNFEVDVVSSGDRAVELYKKKKHDVVVMDLIMPKMSGKKATILIKEFDPEAKIIVISAIIDRKFKEEMMNLGIKAYLEKPLKIKDLIAMIKELSG